jgi:hypothetical protein
MNYISSHKCVIPVPGNNFQIYLKDKYAVVSEMYITKEL